MKYFTKTITEKVIIEGKEVELVSYAPENQTEELYYLQPPPEPTYEGQIKQLILKIFIQIDRKHKGRLTYHFSTHEFLKLQGITQSIKNDMLKYLRETLSYFPKEMVNIHLEDIREYIETYTPQLLNTNPQSIKQATQTIEPLEYLKIFKSQFYSNALKDHDYTEETVNQLYEIVEGIIKQLKPVRVDRHKTKEIIREIPLIFENKRNLIENHLIKALQNNDSYYIAYNYLAQRINRREEDEIWQIKVISDLELINLLKHESQKELSPEKNETENGLSVSDWSIIFYYQDETSKKQGTKVSRILKFMTENGINTTKGNFKKEYHEVIRRINQKENARGETLPPLPPKRIEKILLYLKNNKKAKERAENDMNYLAIEISNQKENDH